MFFPSTPTSVRSRRTCSASPSTTRWQAGVQMDRTDASFYPANGFIARDVLGTRGSSAFVSYNREYDRGSALRRVDASLTYGQRDNLTGLLQSRNLSIY